MGNNQSFSPLSFSHNTQNLCFLNSTLQVLYAAYKKMDLATYKVDRNYLKGFNLQMLKLFTNKKYANSKLAIESFFGEILLDFTLGEQNCAGKCVERFLTYLNKFPIISQEIKFGNNNWLIYAGGESDEDFINNEIQENYLEYNEINFLPNIIPIFCNTNLKFFVHNQTMMLKQNNYKLCGLVLHIGNIALGHYIALVCNSQEVNEKIIDSWFECDDNVINAINVDFYEYCQKNLSNKITVMFAVYSIIA